MLTCMVHCMVHCVVHCVVHYVVHRMLITRHYITRRNSQRGALHDPPRNALHAQRATRSVTRRTTPLQVRLCDWFETTVKPLGVTLTCVLVDIYKA